MTIVSPIRPLDPARSASLSRTLSSPAVLATLICVAAGLLLTADRTGDVWRTGIFFDTDDATRAVQVRSWLAGQSWFDLGIARMDPPAGVFMHWSRVVDVPLAILISLGKLAASPQTAERLARIVFPTALLLALYAACGAAAATLSGRAARAPAIVLAFLGGPMLGQFVPGRIDHHAPQIVLLVAMTGAILAAFDAKHAGRAALAGVCMALSLAVSLENVPFFAVAAASFLVFFVLRGAQARAALLAFACGLAVSLLVFFAATVAPLHWLVPACDAYSIAHLAPALVGAASLAVLALAAPRLTTLKARLAATAAVAPLPIVAAALVAPQCLGDPFVGLDPLVRLVWLHNVAEVEPVTSFARSHPWSAVALCGPLLLALIVAVIEAVRGSGLSRGRFVFLAALIAVGLATSQWGVRALSSGLPLVAIVGASVMLRAGSAISGNSMPARVAAMGLAAIPFAPLALALALPSDPPGARGGDSLACLTPQALAPLSALPSGTVLAPIDTGAHILAFTQQSVLGAPYHRDNHGNRLVLDAFLATPDDAKSIVARSGASYVAICAPDMQARIMAERAPQGLAADLMAGRVPSWLERVPSEGPQTIYRVVAAGR